MWLRDIRKKSIIQVSAVERFAKEMTQDDIIPKPIGRNEYNDKIEKPRSD